MAESQPIAQPENPQVKTCPTCLEVKAFECFGISRKTKTGRTSYCRPCIKARGAAYYEKCREKIRARTDAYTKQNWERRLERQRKWRSENPEYGIEWRLKELEKHRVAARTNAAKRRNNPRAKLDNAISCSVRDRLTRGVKAGRKWQSLVGYTTEELVVHLEKLFQPGMTWENYGRGGWHVDHVVPLAAFNYEFPEHIDFKRAWALSNLQPLWEIDNFRKSTKLSKSFQPSLAF